LPLLRSNIAEGEQGGISVDVGDRQKKLSLWAAQDKALRFFDLYHLLHQEDWLRTAQRHVKQHIGSRTAGCDGVTMQDFEKD
jgi:RNA-directed DNA polymerase